MNCEWATPQPLFDKLNEEFRFTVDVCATPENAKCAKYFTKEGQNGEIPRWAGEVAWMNPPYGKEIEAWVEMALSLINTWGTVTVALIPTRTNAPWWHDFVMRADEIRFIRKKVSFEGVKKGVAFTGHAIVVFRGTQRSSPKVSSYDQPKKEVK